MARCGFGKCGKSNEGLGDERAVREFMGSIRMLLYVAVKFSSIARCGPRFCIRWRV